MNESSLYDYVNCVWDESILATLMDYIKIPNKSPDFDANWQEGGHMEKAIDLIVRWCELHAPIGMTLKVMRLPCRTPLIYMEIPGSIDKTVLLYGHCDKQPEMEGWDESLGPWKPVLREGKLYGRGGADDGYAVFASLTAINALQKQGIAHPRCVVIIEACEESGSYDLPYYIDELATDIGEPELVICLDSGAGNYEQLWMTTSLRGNVVGQLNVSLLREGVHSGNASGIVADSFRVAKQLLSRVEDEQTGDILLPELEVDIPAQRVEQAAECAAVLGDAVFSEFPFHDGVSPICSDKQQLVLNRTWRAALSVIGAQGLPPVADGGNVSRPSTQLKLSMRIPPTCDPDKAVHAMKKALTDNPPYQARVSFECDDGAMGWSAPPLEPWLEQAVDAASQAFYQKPAVYMGEGGTIPFMGMLGEKFPKAQFMITGVLGPQSNAHGPNEFLHIEMAKKLTCCVAYVIEKQGQHKSA